MRAPRADTNPPPSVIRAVLAHPRIGDRREAVNTCASAGKVEIRGRVGGINWPTAESTVSQRSAYSHARTHFEAEGIVAMTIDKPQISAADASGGKKLGVMRYVLGISVALAVVAGVILWNVYATH